MPNHPCEHDMKENLNKKVLKQVYWKTEIIWKSPLKFMYEMVSLSPVDVLQ